VAIELASRETAGWVQSMISVERRYFSIASLFLFILHITFDMGEPRRPQAGEEPLDGRVMPLGLQSTMNSFAPTAVNDRWGSAFSATW
jgi:hypothetical protein